MSALKPCPFCGGEARIVSGCPGSHYVRCSQCHAATDDGGYERACDLWNSRHEPSAPSTASALSDARDAAFEESAPIRAALAPSPEGVEVDPNFRKIAWEIADECWLDTASKHDLSKRIEGALTALLDQATRRAEEAEAERDGLISSRLAMKDRYRKAAADAGARAEAAEARCSALEQALEPFARVVENAETAAAHYDVDHRSEVLDTQLYGSMGISWGDLRRAREALSSTASSITEKETPDA